MQTRGSDFREARWGFVPGKGSEDEEVAGKVVKSKEQKNKRTKNKGKRKKEMIEENVEETSPYFKIYPCIEWGVAQGVK